MRVGRNVLATMLLTPFTSDEPSRSFLRDTFKDAVVTRAERVESPHAPAPYARGCYLTVRRVFNNQEIVLFSVEKATIEACPLYVGDTIPVRPELFMKDTVNLQLEYRAR